MKRFLLFAAFIFIYIQAEARTIRCEVSIRFDNGKVSSSLYRFCSLNDAAIFVNNYLGTANFKVVLCDKELVLKETVVFSGVKNKVLVTSKSGDSRITSGDVIKFAAKGDTLIAPVARSSYMLLKYGVNVPLATTFTGAAQMKMLRNVEQKTKYEYTATFTTEDMEKMEVGCDLFIYSRWMCYKTRVTDIDYKHGRVTFNTQGWELSYLKDSEARYEIYNSRKILKPGLFCFHNNTIYYLPTQGEGIANDGFRVPKLQTLLKVVNCQNITFKNIVFGDAVLNNWYYKNWQGECLAPSCVLVEHSNNISFRECDFFNNMGYSLCINHDSYDCSVTGCSFTDLHGGGIMIGYFEGGRDTTHDITIDNNLIKSYGKIHAGSDGILSAMANHVSITNNTICDGYYTAVHIGWSWGFGGTYNHNYIVNNHIHHVMQGVTSDGGGVYTLGNQEGTVIENNEIHDIISWVVNDAALIYFDEGSSGIIARNNYCYGSHMGIHQHYGKNNRIEGNKIAYSNSHALHLSNVKLSSDIISLHNTIDKGNGEAYNKNFSDLASCKNDKIIKFDSAPKSKKCGVKYMRLKRLSGLSNELIEGDKQFVCKQFSSVSIYFSR